MREWLTKRRRDVILYELNNSIKANKIDKKMIPFLLEFNKISFVVSTYCCQGHKVITKDVVTSGYLSMMTFKKYFKEIMSFLSSLCENNIICAVEATYYPDILFLKDVNITVRWDVKKRDIVLRKLLCGFRKIEKGHNL